MPVPARNVTIRIVAVCPTCGRVDIAVEKVGRMFLLATHLTFSEHAMMTVNPICRGSGDDVEVTL